MTARGGGHPAPGSWRDRPVRDRIAAASAAFLLACAIVLVLAVPAQVERACLRLAAAGQGLAPAAAQAAQAAAVGAEVGHARWFAAGLGAAILGCGILAAAILGARLARPFHETIGALEAISTGDLTPKLVNGMVQDEASRMADAFNRSLGSIRDTMQAFAAHAQELAAASAGLVADSGRMRSHAEETSSLSAQVSDASEEADRSIRTVAAGIEEMGTSIGEIAKNASEAARIAASAVQVTDGANAIFVKLGESSAEIGNVLKVITSIAEQTNLLALNATIEAARAGEAGRGFAVVANEVKELARQAARAAEDIALKIRSIQSETTRATQAIVQIDRTINNISDIQVVIANAVEEQTATSMEIGRNIAEVARASSGIGRAIAGVVVAARETLDGVKTRDGVENEIAKTATRLKGLVERYRL